MNVTYIYHSGYAVEFESCCFLFDYFKGKLPPCVWDKELFVFASHIHKDHFNPQLFELFKDKEDVTFVLSSDIDLALFPGVEALQRERPKKIVFAPPDARLTLQDARGDGIELETFLSTDCGVAFLLTCGGKTVFHAGDLNWWAWPDDTEAEAEDMKNRFFAQLEQLRGRKIDLAFLSLDPRQGALYSLGFDAYMRACRIANAFPMHYWHKTRTVEAFRSSPAAADYRDRVLGTGKENTTYLL